ncbi:MAG: 50S ribosomal protein L35 [Sedimentisphaerales bacterium]|nr:50S ribosomal protein L35 [Sedimentisphaerales bacterium]
MPKQKTHKGLKKRVKVTATGKIKHKKSGAGHLMSKKSAKIQKRVTSSSIMNPVSAAKALIKLGK